MRRILRFRSDSIRLGHYSDAYILGWVAVGDHAGGSLAAVERIEADHGGALADRNRLSWVFPAESISQ